MTDIESTLAQLESLDPIAAQAARTAMLREESKADDFFSFRLSRAQKARLHALAAAANMKAKDYIVIKCGLGA